MIYDDPLTCLFTSDLYLKALELNIDPNDTDLVATAPIQGLVCLGCGNGEFIQYILEKFKPFNLIILVSRWEDLICSFDNLDWSAIYTYYDSSPNHRILLGRINDDPYQTLTYLSSFGLVSMEGMLIYSPSSSDKELLDIKPLLVGREAQNLILYQGYTIDEYNMIYNSALFSRKPKIYSSPSKQIATSVIVVGSGPSLDESINSLKTSVFHVIVCGGSNYRTLMKNGIVPDFLVLVERADEVFDSYKSMYDEFGKSSTKLVVSSTCSDRLADLYDDVCIFYRPALTPLVVFGEGDHQKISYEGPQAVCAAFSFAMNMRPDSVLLVGVDFGSSDETLQRSADAVGYSPHTWSHKAIGNFKDSVYTDRRLLDCRDVIALRIKSSTDLTQPPLVFNISDGVLIDYIVQVAVPLNMRQTLVWLAEIHGLC